MFRNLKMKRIRKSLSIVTLAMFMCTMTGIGNLAAAVAPVTPIFKVTNGVNDILLANEQGKVIETFKGNSKKTVICIQDLHANKEVQDNISEILNVLEESYGKNLDKVFVEGSWSKLDMNLIKAVPNTYGIKDAIVSDLVERGFMTGAEQYAANNLHTELYGIEAENLYKYNAKLLIESLKEREKALEIIQLLKERKDAFKKKRFTKEQLTFSDIVDKYEAGQISVIKYVKILARYSKRLGINFGIEAPNLSKILLLLDYKIRIGELNAVKAEAKYLEEMIAPKLGKKEIQRLNNLKQENNTRYYLYLKKIVDQNSINLKKYRLLDLYFRYLEVLGTLNTNLLVEEEQNIKAKIYSFLIMTEEQKKLVEIENILNSYEDFVNNSVSSIEAAKFLANEEQYFNKISNFVGRNTGYLIWAFQVRKGLPQLAKCVKIMKAFYEYAEKRNSVLVNNTLRYRNDVSVMVLGGFHTKGITELLRNKDISYVLITPNIRKDHNNSIYEQRLQQQAGFVRDAVMPRLGKDKLALVSIYQDVPDGQSRADFLKDRYFTITGENWIDASAASAANASKDGQDEDATMQSDAGQVKGRYVPMIDMDLVDEKNAEEGGGG